MKTVVYFNFPIQLLSGFMQHERECLINIFDYALTKRANSLEFGSQKQRFKDSAEYFGVTVGNTAKSLKNGTELIDSMPERSPMVGISRELFFEYYTNDKTEWDKACLLAYLALKSIIVSKPYCKVTNDYLFSRMAGLVNSSQELPAEIAKFKTERLTRKLKLELSLNWGLVTYSRYTRGFYASFTLSLEDLIYQVEKKRKTRLEAEHKDKQKQAYEIAMAKLNSG
jgi:hypothetical protein